MTTAEPLHLKARPGSKPGGLSPRQELVATALATGATQREASAACNVAPRTVAKWCTSPAFAAAVKGMQATVTGRALGKMIGSLSDAATTLHGLLASESDAVKLGASRAIIELTVRVKESVEFETRLRELESRLAGGPP